MIKTLFLFFFLVSIIAAKVQNKITDEPNFYKIDEKVADSFQSKIDDKVTGLDTSVTEEKEVVPSIAPAR